MQNLSKDAAADVVSLMQAVLAPQKVHQVIFDIVVTTTPTKARIRFSTVLDGVAFVTLSLFETGGQIAGAFALPFAPSNYSTSFTGLPQNTKLEVRIDVTDPRPPGEQLPGGIVSAAFPVTTGNRTASVRLRSIKEIQGEAEITFVTRLYDFDGVEGDAISAILRWGRGHMDPDGTPIGDPFGPPLLFSEAPDQIAIYTLADVQTFNIAPGLGFSGLNLPDKFPNDAPYHQIGDGYNDTTAQTIVALPDVEGPFDVSFSYMSGLFDYVFVVEGFIEGEVTTITETAQQASSGGSHRRRSLSFSPEDLSISVALETSPIAIVSCGDALRTFQLMVDGGVARLRAGARRQTDLERLGDLVATRLVAAGRADGDADLLALAADASLHHTRANAQRPVTWRNLEVKLAAEPAAVRAPGGSLHVFGVDVSGTLCHATISDAAASPRWERLGDGFSPRVSCACNDSGEAHLFARRDQTLVRAGFMLGDGALKPPHFETSTAPFAGPAMVGVVRDGRFAALGCDERHVFWLQAWDGHHWEKSWRRIGTMDDLFLCASPEAQKRSAGAPRHLPASRPAAGRKGRAGGRAG